MKKSLVKISILFSLVAVAFVACKKDEDTEAPVITIIGSDPFTQNIGDVYVDAGATATDNEDGTITSRITTESHVNEDSAGTYEVHYDVSDNAGNSTHEARTVIVQNSLETSNAQWRGIYDVTEICGGANPAYKDTISFSPLVNGRIWFTRFANYLNAKIYADISGNTVTVPQQSVVAGTGTTPPTRLFSGTGSINTAAGVTTMIINMSETTNGTTVTCTETYTK